MGPGSGHDRDGQSGRLGPAAPGSEDPSPGLERRLVQNEQTLGKNVAALWALEQRAAALLEHLRLRPPPTPPADGLLDAKRGGSGPAWGTQGAADTTG